jgi:hypothetical protein
MVRTGGCRRLFLSGGDASIGIYNGGFVSGQVGYQERSRRQFMYGYPDLLAVGPGCAFELARIGGDTMLR